MGSGEASRLAGAPERPFLGVYRSALGRHWRPRLSDPRQAYALAEAHDIPELLARILAGRGVTVDTASETLAPSLRRSLPNPSVLADMDRAAARLAKAIRAGEGVCVFGDYDVDGATSAAILKRFFDAVGGALSIYIPDRVTEGYGPNGPALKRIAASGVSLVVTVDCGIQSFGALEEAQQLSLDVVVIDHHQAGPRLPDALACVNPNRLDDTSRLGMLAAAGLTFLLTIAVNRALRDGGWYAQEGLDEPDLLAFLDLVALGTVCDVVPLIGLNRVFVSQGLKVLRRTGNLGLQALAEVAGLSEAADTYHLGFVLGPRVNAGGRVGQADLGARLLTTEDAVEARQIAVTLDRHNRERQAIEAIVLDEAVELVARGQGQLSDHGPILVAGEGWHPGVVGIVASRLKERFGRPALVIGLGGNVGKGSGRSVPGVDLGRAVRGAADAGLLIAGGGHAMAAGLTVARGGLEALRADLENRLAGAIAAATADPSLALDGVIASLEDGEGLHALIAKAGPFGAGYPEPVFAIPDLRLAFMGPVGQGHLRLSLVAPDGARIKAIAFRAADSALGAFLAVAQGRSFHAAGRLKPDRTGRGLELHLEDAGFSDDVAHAV